MNLNKYDSQGFPYTAEEAAERAAALFMPHYVCKGYKREVYPAGNPLAGMPIPEAKVLPYDTGRNAAKRAARQIRGVRK